MSLREHKKKQTATETLGGLLVDGDLLAIRARVDADFATQIERKIETFVHPIVEELSQGQLSEPIDFGAENLRRLAALYCDALRNTVGKYAEELLQAVANRQRLGPRQLQLIMHEANRIIAKQTSGGAASGLIASVSAYFQVGDHQAAEEVLSNDLSILATPVAKNVAETIRHAQALYGERPVPEPTPTDKMTNPALYPTMTVPEVMKVLKRSRSTVHRYLDEGKLKRARLRGAILTTSVAGLLKENL